MNFHFSPLGTLNQILNMSSQDYREKLVPYVIDQIPMLNSAKEQKMDILVEGANAIMLDIDYG